MSEESVRDINSLRVLKKNDLQELLKKLAARSDGISLPDALTCLRNGSFTAFLDNHEPPVAIPKQYWGNVTLDDFKQWVSKDEAPLAPLEFLAPEEYRDLASFSQAIKHNQYSDILQTLERIEPILNRHGKKVKVRRVEPCAEQLRRMISSQTNEKLETADILIPTILETERAWRAWINRSYELDRAYVSGDHLKDFLQSLATVAEAPRAAKGGKSGRQRLTDQRRAILEFIYRHAHKSNAISERDVIELSYEDLTQWGHQHLNSDGDVPSLQLIMKMLNGKDKKWSYKILESDSIRRMLKNLKNKGEMTI